MPPGEDPETCQSWLRMRFRDGRYNLMFEEWVVEVRRGGAGGACLVRRLVAEPVAGRCRACGQAAPVL